MLIEALRHALLRCPPHLKRLGVLHDLIALEHRAARQKQAWLPHHHRCHRAVTSLIHAAGFAPDRQGLRAVVLGSGLLLEAPLELLSSSFDEVLCIDLYHLPCARRRAAPFRNITFEARDITGVLAGLPGSLKDGLPQPQADFGAAFEADFVLSSNCLSQLAGIPLAVADAVGGHRPDHLVAWERQFLSTHLDGLARCRGAVALLADSRREVLNAKTRELQDWVDLTHGVPWPALEHSTTWWWDLAPAPEEGRKISVRHSVTAGLVHAVQR